MVSKRTLGTEIGNGENLKGHHLADGVTYIMRTGKEYDGIFAVWDWQRLPGATIEQKEDPFPQVDTWLTIKGTTDFVGGVSDGTYGAAAMHVVRGDLKAQKSWFFFDKEFVALGAGINCSSDNPIFTSINQSLLQGEVTVGDTETTAQLERGRHPMPQAHWVHHDQTAYVFPGGADIMVQNCTQSGSWQEINRSKPGTTEHRAVFSLWLDHGRQPRGGTYEYIVAPGLSVDETKEYAQKNHLRILENTAKLQAVWHEELEMLQAVFWQPGQVTCPTDLVVSVDRPCLLLLQRRADELHVAISDPQQKLSTINLKINAPLSGHGTTWCNDEGMSLVSFELPGKALASKSVVRRLGTLAGSQHKR